MKAELDYVGNLKVIAESKTELYALKKWIEDSVCYDKNIDHINILMGSFDVSDNFVDDSLNGKTNSEYSLLDHVIEMESYKGIK